MQFLLIWIFLNFVQLINSFADNNQCDIEYQRALLTLKRCLNSHPVMDRRTVEKKFKQLFLTTNSNISEQILFAEMACANIKDTLECQANYTAGFSQLCLDGDDFQIIEIYAHKLLSVWHNYFCDNEMAKILEVFENDGVRFMNENLILKMCAQNVPNINSITLEDNQTLNNIEFCTSLNSSYECIYKVFEQAPNQKLKDIIFDVFKIGRDIIQCENQTSTDGTILT